MSITLEQFVTNLVRSGLFSPEEAMALLERVAPEAHSAPAQPLIDELISAGRLTRFQASMISEGRTRGLVLGEYTLLDRIGSGGMGEVFKAQHRTMDRVVAIKILRRGGEASEALLKRFDREVRAAARLMHPNIVTALDAGQQQGMRYLVMEYVDGPDLGELVKQRGPLPVEEAVDYICQAAAGLEYAHAHGVIHRDIKPRNILVSQSGTVKILDMGLARITDASPPGEGLTVRKKVLGTCDYLAPEQAEDAGAVDHRADIYSLGCTLYYALTGKPPYKRSTVMKTVLAHREDPIPSLCEARHDLPPALDAVFRTMVAKRPEDRYQDMGRARQQLQVAIGRATEPSADQAGGFEAEPELASFLQRLESPDRKAGRPGVSARQPAAPETRPARPGRAPAARKRLNKRTTISVALAGGALIAGWFLLIFWVFLGQGTGAGRHTPDGGEDRAARTSPSEAPGETALQLVWPSEQRQGATLKLDGASQAIETFADHSDPSLLRIPIKPGEHTIEITRPGFQSFRRRFLVTPGETFAIELELRPDRAP